MKERFENILLIAGCGQNIGKTTLICQILQKEKSKFPVAVKVTPHFHETTEGLVKIEKANDWILFEETNSTSNKDSSLYLQNGAAKSYLIQTSDKGLPEAFSKLKIRLPQNLPVIIESAALIEVIEPGFFIVILPKEKCQKEKINRVSKKADQILISNGEEFQPSPEKISFNNSWCFE